MTTNYPMYSYPVRAEMTAQERRVAALDRAIRITESSTLVTAEQLIEIAAKFDRFIEKGGTG